MSAIHSPTSEPRRPGWWGGFLLLLPLFSLGVTVAWLRSRAPSPGAVPEAPAERVDPAVDAWLGQATLEEGVHLRASLTRLHAAPGPQAFDAARLRERLGLGGGEPFELELEQSGEGGADLDLGALQVRDAQGLVARPLAPLDPPGPGEVADPLRVVLTPPARLAPGERATIVLWGRAPVGLARLEVAGSVLRLRRDSLRAPERGSLLASLPREGDED